MIKAAICDDQPQMVGQIQTFLEQLAKDYHYELELHAYLSGEELIKICEQDVMFDIIYLDIEMLGKDGIETAKYIRKRDYHVLIIYISSHDEYLRQLFEVEPFRFLQKPVKYEEFCQVFFQAAKRIIEKQEHFYYFKTGKNVIKIACQDILYIESSGRKVIVHTKQHTYEYYDKLNDVEQRLTGQRFIRIHKAYLVNIHNVESFQYERLALIDGTILNISEKNRPRIRSEFWHYYKGETP